MIYRVSSMYRRLYVIIAASVAFAGALYGLLLNSDPTQPVNLALIAVLVTWILFVARRAWRSATLLAFDDGITVRELVKTTSMPWDMIDHFFAATRSVPLLGMPVRVQRGVLGAQLRSGRTRWFPELSCRAARGGTMWVDSSAARLNELLGMRPESDGVAPAGQ
jgi:hypothetical protein